MRKPQSVRKAFIICTLIYLCISNPIDAKVSDVARSDSNYKAIQHAIDQGYLSLNEGNKFSPDKAVTRQELAFILKKLQNKQYENLSQAEWQELSKLASSFKTVLTKAKQQDDALQADLKTLHLENQALNHDLAKLSDELSQHKAENQTWIISAIAIAVLGILF